MSVQSRPNDSPPRQKEVAKGPETPGSHLGGGADSEASGNEGSASPSSSAADGGKTGSTRGRPPDSESRPPPDVPATSSLSTDNGFAEADLDRFPQAEPKEESEEKPGQSRAQASRRRRGDVSESLWIKCPTCSKLIYKPRMEEMLFVCPECNFHFEIPSGVRIATMVDEGSFEERFQDLEPLDPLNFRAHKAYRDRLKVAQKKTGLKDACVVGTARMDGIPLVFGVSDSRFLRGSMGAVVGEKICRGVELAISLGVPFVFVSGSGGGARMDEGILSLMQMAKTSAAVASLGEKGGLFISILTNPTMGGAMASFAALGDVIIAEPGALIGFAGPNVIRQTIRSEIPEGFQTSEFLLEHGFLDLIVQRPSLRTTVIRLLKYLDKQGASAT